jgi:hypothetical protein
MRWDFGSSGDWGDPYVDARNSPVASPLFPEISSGRQARPRADERDRRRGHSNVRMSKPDRPGVDPCQQDIVACET